MKNKLTFEQKIAELGCSNYGCEISGRTSGMHTNGRCKCIEVMHYASPLQLKLKIKTLIRLYQEKISDLEDSIRQLKDDLTETEKYAKEYSCSNNTGNAY